MLTVAFMACLIGYGEVGLYLKSGSVDPSSGMIPLEDNPYRKWIEDYSGDEYQEAVRNGIGKPILSCTSQKIQ